MNELKELFTQFKSKLLLFTGDWCPMCLVELPRIMKLVSDLDIGKDEFQIIDVNRYKSEPAALIEKHNIKFVPTLILLADNYDIGRIVEYPKISWESDILNLLKAYDV